MSAPGTPEWGKEQEEKFEDVLASIRAVRGNLHAELAHLVAIVRSMQGLFCYVAEGVPQLDEVHATSHGMFSGFAASCGRLCDELKVDGNELTKDANSIFNIIFVTTK